MSEVVVLGGGVAGAALARQLARLEHRVLLVEERPEPGHKLCGEFLSPEALGLLRALGLEAEVRRAGAVPIGAAEVVAPGGGRWRAPLGASGLGLSRLRFDRLLLDAAVKSGAELRWATRAEVVRPDGAGGFRVGLRQGDRLEEVGARIVVGAHGKRSVIEGALGGPGRPGGEWVAFKAHYRGGPARDDVCLYAARGAYLGLSPIEDGRTNLCLLATAAAFRWAGSSFSALLEAMAGENRALGERLAGLAPAGEEVLSAAGFSFAPRGPLAGHALLVGDAAALIAPLAGDGMAMALRSAELAAPLVASALRGAMTLAGARDEYARDWRGEFLPRLRLGRVLQGILLRPRLVGAGLGAIRLYPPLGRLLIRRTRGLYPDDRPAGSDSAPDALGQDR